MRSENFKAHKARVIEKQVREVRRQLGLTDRDVTAFVGFAKKGVNPWPLVNHLLTRYDGGTFNLPTHMIYAWNREKG